MTQLNTFIQTIKNNGVAKPSHFMVDFALPPFMMGDGSVEQSTLSMVKLFCEGAAFPEMALATATIKDFGVNREVVYDKMYGQLPLTFICDQGMYIKQFFDAWIQSIAPYRGGLFTYPDRYTAKTLTIYQLDAAKRPVYGVTFHNIYPKIVNDVQLSASAKDYNRFQVMFTYERWESYLGTQPEATEGMKAAKSLFDNYRDGILLPTREVTSSPIDTAYELLEQSTQFIDSELGINIPPIFGDIIDQVANAGTAIVDEANNLTNQVNQVVDQLNNIIT